uniref:Integrase_H2C2 domain-containing protein n=1 Tax=Anopheles funestus TaxID=62324 RepID=A0A182RL82_ANOFN
MTIPEIRFAEVVKPYAGEGDINGWLTRFERAAGLRKLKNVAEMLPLFLEGGSALLFDRLNEEQRKELEKVKESLKTDVPSFFWVDSTIVLHWLSGTPSRWKQFVANRVLEIQHLTERLNRSHVTGEQNPADIISRGMMPTHLRDAALWWHGPAWLCQLSSAWPSQNPCFELSSQELEERMVVHAGQENAPNPIFSLRSSFMGLVRLVAYLRRFWYNCNPTHRALRRVGYLRTSELQEATQALLRSAQRECFDEEINDLQRYGNVKRSSGLKTLCPIIHDGVMRIGGRLRNAPVSYDRKHPIILAASHPLTMLIVQHYHRNLLHAGQQLMISTIREKFWPIRIRNLVRKVVHDCVQCFRLKPTTNEQMMGKLPAERVTPTLPFLTTGVDLCVPLLYRIGGRKTAPVKCYVAIFVCMLTKALHVELIDNLSTPSFIATLKRFVARRGKPNLIERDNATNFRGAARTLKELQQLFETQ